MTSSVQEDYLKAILTLSGETGRASTAALARRLGVAAPSVTGMLRKMNSARPRLVIYEKGRGASLTTRGRLKALQVLRSHRLIELFLYETLGYPLDEVHSEAERLEHAVSKKLGGHIARKLGYPEKDPHGHPIPRANGTLRKRREASLLSVPVGSTAKVSSVSDSSPEMLKHLTKLEIVPNAQLDIVERSPFDGPLLVRLRGTLHTRVLSPALAEKVQVSLVRARRK